MISVCFERGGKISSSKDRSFIADNLLLSHSSSSAKVFPVNETLNLVVSLYKDPKDGTFQDKKGKLILRHRKSNLLGGYTYAVLGGIDLKLNEIANELGIISFSFNTFLFSRLLTMHKTKRKEQLLRK